MKSNAKHFAEDDIVKTNTPVMPPKINFDDDGEFEGFPEMDGLTTKSVKQVENLDEENNSEDEGIDDYKIGGYHPVHIGEVIMRRYVVIQKLGWGHFSTVWLCKDFKYDTYVALKIQKSAPHYLEAAYDEVEILQRVGKQAGNVTWIEQLKEYYQDDAQKNTFTRDDCQVVQLLNSFVYRGPYGNHFCMVFEILGVNLLEIIKRYNYKGIPMHLARAISKQILIGLDFLHRFCDVIHTDLKPENVLLCLTQEEIKQIVEKGQFDNSKTFQERIKFYQKAHGICFDEVKLVDQSNGHSMFEKEKVSEESEEDVMLEKPQKGGEGEEEEEGNKSSLTRKQKKNQRRKATYKRKKENKKSELKEHVNGQEEKKSEDKERIADVKEEDIPDEIRFTFDNWNGRGERLSPNVRVKIADLGNACWTYHHFATEIQTRQYRSPETIIGVHYNTTADIWSFACMIFEMMTGDFLFEPRKGPNFSKNDDHLAQVQELCNKFSTNFALSGLKAKKYFDSEGSLRRIPSLHYWPLLNVLIEKYHIKEDEAKMFNDFMQIMLKTNPAKRASARDCLQTEWIKGKCNYLFKYSDTEFTRYFDKKQLLQEEDLKLDSREADNSENDDADNSDNNESIATDCQSEFNDEKFYGKCSSQIDQKLVDRSFTNLGYIGYGEGIKLEDLDQDPNWQFMNNKNAH